MFKIQILPHTSIDINEEESLLEGLQRMHIPISSSCGGKGKCRDCLVKITGGYEYLNKPTDSEKALLGNVFHLTKERLSCQIKVEGNISIEIMKREAKKIILRKNKDIKKKKI